MARLVSCLTATVVMVVLVGSSGCTVVRLARGGDGGATVRPIQPGVPRTTAEAVLPAPVREWTSAGVRFAVYEFDAGCPPRRGDAGAAAFMNLISLGLWEVYMGLPRLWGHDPLACRAHATGRVILSYDDRDTVVGIFDEFAELPADGRSGPRTWR